MTSDFEGKIKEIFAGDPRYRREAYVFLFESLRYTLERMGVQRHVSGRELLEGIRDYARDQFGGLARMVFDGWGIHCTEDFGEMIFHLVDQGLMGKTDQDSIEDFKGVYDFENAFPFDDQPSRKRHPS